ncbi:hypothetical protein BV898_10831 [Hypsibius exemplaris]|uniref:Uncharacterized protein n=1 Tax=Hypsibius exemplaris TaxID=2072580 RepID=A0A1W0WI91_HYPEX|nr:hypothetical protein BV898_10831 [Hypsibius exemplaris]
MAPVHVIALLLTIGCCGIVHGTYRYYGSYLSYGMGETIMYVLHMYGGSLLPHRKWQIECQDGEAVTGIQDFVHDFERLETVKCSFMFPYKPPAQGRYPYYPHCHVRNYTNQFFCYDPQNNLTMNTFITGIYDQLDFLWQVWRPGNDDIQPYKCCSVPHGYYIDYVSCYYMPTHDMYFEYYDSGNNIITECATGYIATGISKKLNPWTALYNVDWIQCCL